MIIILDELANMNWTILQKNERNTNREAPAYLRISKSGITFSKAAEREWIHGKRFAEIYTDKEAKKVAFVFLKEITPNAFTISKTGTRGPAAKITCKNLFTMLELKESVRLSGEFDEAANRVEAQF